MSRSSIYKRLDNASALVADIRDIKTNLLRMVLESSVGLPFDSDARPVRYKNYGALIPMKGLSYEINSLGDMLLSIGEGYSVIGGYLTENQMKENARIIYTFLTQQLGLTSPGAVAAVANMMQESGLNPGAYNKGEKSGTYRGSSANGGGYGAGIIQWSLDWKWKIEEYAGRKVEECTLNEQLNFLAMDFSGDMFLRGAKTRFSRFRSAEAMYNDPVILASAWLAAIEMPGLWQIFKNTGSCNGKGQEGNRQKNVSKVLSWLQR